MLVIPVRSMGMTFGDFLYLSWFHNANMTWVSKGKVPVSGTGICLIGRNRFDLAGYGNVPTKV